MFTSYADQISDMQLQAYQSSRRLLRPSTTNSLIKVVAKYLRSTMHWGIRYKLPKHLSHLPAGEPYTELQDDPNNPFPVNINLPLLQCFVDAAHGNDLRKRRSTTGIVFTYCGGAVLHRSKTQTLTDGSSTESEFIAAVTAAKLARYLPTHCTQATWFHPDQTNRHLH
jgi:hypothetical protein